MIDCVGVAIRNATHSDRALIKNILEMPARSSDRMNMIMSLRSVSIPNGSLREIATLSGSNGVETNHELLLRRQIADKIYYDCTWEGSFIKKGEE